MRQAQLGASYRVRVSIGQSLASSSYRVLRLWRSSGWSGANKTGGAYTGDIAGRREALPSQGDSAPLMTSMQLATVLTCRKPVRRNRRLFAGLALSTEHGQIPEGLSGSKSMACNERSTRNFGDPFSLLYRGGRMLRPKEEHQVVKSIWCLSWKRPFTPSRSRRRPGLPPETIAIPGNSERPWTVRYVGSSKPMGTGMRRNWCPSVRCLGPDKVHPPWEAEGRGRGTPFSFAKNIGASACLLRKRRRFFKKQATTDK